MAPKGYDTGLGKSRETKYHELRANDETLERSWRGY